MLTRTVFFDKCLSSCIHYIVSLVSSMSTQVIPMLQGGSGGGGVLSPPAPSLNPTERVQTDMPPFSRVFVVCSKQHREDELRTAFEQFGKIEDVWMVKVSL